MEPEPPEPWVGTFDATHEGSPCFSREMFSKSVIGDENCLVVNVFTNKIPTEENAHLLKPVMFFIHGGGYFTGSSSKDIYGPDFLIAKDVVLVTINYRLGVFGFLSFEDSTLNIPGNAGLKDQVMALRWVQNNISKFGGDPHNVTIFGESCGAASVHLLMLSPLAKGLFHKAIAQSGSALYPWAKVGEAAKLLCDTLQIENEGELLKYLRRASCQEILEVQEKIINDTFFLRKKFILGFVVEVGITGSAFLTDEPLKVISQGNFNDVPFIIGITSAEWLGLSFLDVIRSVETEDFLTYVPEFFGYEEVNKTAIADKIQRQYFGIPNPVSDPNQLCIALSDSMFVFAIYLAALEHAKNAQAHVFFYRMSWETSLNFYKLHMKIKEPGAAHMDDLGYLFKNFMSPSHIEPGTLEDISIRKMTTLWANFAHFGHPTPDPSHSLLNVEWQPMAKNHFNFLEIAEHNVVMLSDPESKRMQFWLTLFRESPKGREINLNRS